ncbi:hypothetical protein MAM1_0098d05130 [Mucor ambiguus]|uniref:Velvet domain-containing protein n=1 Tax=Mucor ambiguus TaxID=91626 RepID=A0A0C9MQT4_9FUNG|nr:hypothetical protein MAM1_0098d05130 [Mucor ambiguus]
MAQNTPPQPQSMSNDSDDLFNNLINYDEEHDELLPTNTQTQQPPAITFLESHTDLSAKFSFKNHQNELFNMNNENLKKMMSDHGKSEPDTKLDIVEQPQQCRMSGYGEKDRRPIDPAPIVRLVVVDNANKSTQQEMPILHNTRFAMVGGYDEATRRYRRNGPASTAISDRITGELTLTTKRFEQ